MTPSDRKTLTTTSFAILGQLALKPWTMYDLARHMREEVGRFFPRAESQIYAEPKRLGALGLVTSRTESTGRRRRTVYEITEEGRHELAIWMAQQPQRGPQVEFEGLLKVFLSTCAEPEDTQATILAIRNEAEASLRDAELRRSRLKSEAAELTPADTRGWRHLEAQVQVEEFLKDFAVLLESWSSRCLARGRGPAPLSDEARRNLLLAELGRQRSPAEIEPGAIAVGWGRA